jgi:hypothetical protein
MAATAIATVVPYEEYRASPGLNHTHLSKMDTSPLACKVDTDKPQTKALRLGRLNHLCTLEHELFLDHGVVWPGGVTKTGKPTTNKNSADYKEFVIEQEALGKSVVDQSDLDLCERIRVAIITHPTASMYLTETKNELSIYWEHRLGLPCKSRIDALGSARVIDLKFLRDLRPHKVNRAITEYHYDSQAAFYSDAVFALTQERRPYYIIAAEKVQPFDVVVFELDDEVLRVGRSKYERWMRRFIECTESGIWPGISDWPVKVELPQWYCEDELTKAISFEGMEIESV